MLRRRKGTVFGHEEQRMQALLTEAIQDGRVVIIGPIRQEVLSGIKDQAQFQKLRTALEAFPDETLTTFHYEEAARLFNVCRSRGVSCGATDILTCAVAAQMQWSILTIDQGIQRCISALRTEGLTL